MLVLKNVLISPPNHIIIIDKKGVQLTQDEMKPPQRRISILKDSLRAELGGSEVKIRLVGRIISDEGYRFYAIRAQGMVAETGIDISPAVPDLSAALKNEDKNMRTLAVRTLPFHRVNLNDRGNMSSLLETGGPFMLRNVVEAFGESALSGNMNAISFIVGFLPHEDPGIRGMLLPILECTAKFGKLGAKETLREELDAQRFGSEITDISAAKSRRDLIKILDDSERDRKSS